MVSLKTAEKVLDIFGKPINFDILLASLLTSLALLMTNFLSKKYLIRFHLEKFLNNYNSYILIVFFVSLFLIVIHFGSKKRKEKNDKAFNKYMKKEQDDLFQDEDALAILSELYNYHPRAVNLPMYNQKVLLLQQYQLITKATSQAIVFDMTDPEFPYILQPEAERRIKELVAKESST